MARENKRMDIDGFVEEAHVLSVTDRMLLKLIPDTEEWCTLDRVYTALCFALTAIGFIAVLSMHLADIEQTHPAHDSISMSSVCVQGE